MHIISLAWAGFVCVAPGFSLRALYAASHKIGITSHLVPVLLHTQQFFIYEHPRLKLNFNLGCLILCVFNWLR